jgi:two-component system response regulator HydG
VKPTVLIVDDKPNFLTLLTKVLGAHATVVSARGVRQALEAIESTPPDAVVCDLRMPDGDGLEVLRALRGRGSAAPFILMTAYATVPTAVQAMREGAYDYVTKPFDPDGVRTLVLRALGESAVIAQGVPGPTAAPTPGPNAAPLAGVGAEFGRLLGRSPVMLSLYRMIDRVAPTDATVLILGETGVGKELVAREVHDRSPRAGKRIVAVNCAAIPKALLESELFGYARGSFTGATSDRAGLFEEASGSTLFLDEIGEMRPTLQARLTRVLEERAVRRIGESRERKVDVRLIAATHRDLPAMVKTGEFREDLWYRLNVCLLRVPALRERVEDIPLLAHRFLATRAPLGPRGFSPEALAALAAHAWPGNVRELRSAVERASIVEEGPAIQLGALPSEVRGPPPIVAAGSVRDLTSLTYREVVDVARDEVTRRYLEALLVRHRGNVTAAASQAGVERESFHRLLRRFDLRADRFREEAAQDPTRARGALPPHRGGDDES